MKMAKDSTTTMAVPRRGLAVEPAAVVVVGSMGELTAFSSQSVRNLDVL